MNKVNLPEKKEQQMNKGNLPEKKKGKQPATPGATEPASHIQWYTFDLYSEHSPLRNLINGSFFNGNGEVYCSEEYLRWALQPPWFLQTLHVGLCDKQTKKLLGFISALPVQIKLDKEVFRMAEINILCLQESERKRGYSRIMRKELQRRIRLKKISKAVFVSARKKIAGLDPISTAHYWTYVFNVRKIIGTGGFDVEELREIRELPSATVTPGFRRMEARDASSVQGMLCTYLDQYRIAADFGSIDDVRYSFLPRQGMVYSYIVESPASHQVNDFISFYAQPQIHTRFIEHLTVKLACATYNVTTETSVHHLMTDVLLVAKKESFDAFCMLNVMGNERFFGNREFVNGNNPLYYYLYDSEHASELNLMPSYIGLVIKSVE